MYGVRGQAFEDGTVRTALIHGEPTAMSEYQGGVERDPHVERNVEDHLRNRREASPGLGARLGGWLRGMAGGPGREEIAGAERVRLETVFSSRIDHWVAEMTADALLKAPDSDVRRDLPRIGAEPIPRDPTLRWVRIATAAVDAVHAHVDRGDDERLGRDLGRAMRIASAADLTSSTAPAKWRDQPLSRQLEDASGRRGIEIRNFLSAGPKVDAATAEQAMKWGGVDDGDLNRRLGHVLPHVDRPMPQEKIGRLAWIRDALMTERAMARAGLLGNAEIMRMARLHAGYGMLQDDQSRDGTYRQPAPDARHLPLEERKALVQRTLAAMRPKAAEERTAAPAMPTREANVAAAAAQSRGVGF